MDGRDMSFMAGVADRESSLIYEDPKDFESFITVTDPDIHEYIMELVDNIVSIAASRPRSPEWATVAVTSLFVFPAKYQAMTDQFADTLPENQIASENRFQYKSLRCRGWRRRSALWCYARQVRFPSYDR
jgi:hypothetical protein